MPDTLVLRFTFQTLHSISLRMQWRPKKVACLCTNYSKFLLSDCLSKANDPVCWKLGVGLFNGVRIASDESWVTVTIIWHTFGTFWAEGDEPLQLTRSTVNAEFCTFHGNWTVHFIMWLTASYCSILWYTRLMTLWFACFRCDSFSSITVRKFVINSRCSGMK